METKAAMPEITLFKNDSNILWVNDFTEDSARNFCQSVIKQTNEDPTSPIIVYIDSYGGSVDALAAMVSVLESVPNPLITVAVGKAMSAGAMLLSYGDYRYVGPRARIMIHEVSAGSIGHVNDLQNHTEEIRKLNQRWMNWLAKNCGLEGYEALKAFLTTEKRDLYLTAEEAVRFGIADGLGIPKVLRGTQHEIVTMPEFLEQTKSILAEKKPAKKAKTKKAKK